MFMLLALLSNTIAFIALKPFYINSALESIKKYPKFSVSSDKPLFEELYEECKAFWNTKAQ